MDDDWCMVSYYTHYPVKSIYHVDPANPVEYFVTIIYSLEGN